MTQSSAHMPALAIPICAGSVVRVFMTAFKEWTDASGQNIAVLRRREIPRPPAVVLSHKAGRKPVALGGADSGRHRVAPRRIHQPNAIARRSDRLCGTI